MSKKLGTCSISLAQLCILGEHHHQPLHISGTIQLMDLSGSHQVHAWHVDRDLLQVDHVLPRALREEEQFVEIMPVNIVAHGFCAGYDAFHTCGNTRMLGPVMCGYDRMIHTIKMRENVCALPLERGSAHPLTEIYLITVSLATLATQLNPLRVSIKGMLTSLRAPAPSPR